MTLLESFYYSMSSVLLVCQLMRDAMINTVSTSPLDMSFSDLDHELCLVIEYFLYNALPFVLSTVSGVS